jgi:death-on-curing protein
MEVFLILNGLEIDTTVDEQERVILDLASGRLTREKITAWVRDHVIDMNKE